MSVQFHAESFEGKAWGTTSVRNAWDLPSLKLQYLMAALGHRRTRNARVLEIGCGSGRMLKSVRERDPDLVLSGIDLSETQIDAARRTNGSSNIDYQRGDGEQLPYQNDAFDYVVFLDYLEHVEHPAKSLAEMWRVLQPGGVLHFVCPAEGQFPTIYWFSKRIFRRHFKETTIGHIQQFSFADLERLVAEAGFEVSERRYSYHLLGSLMDYTLFTLLLNSKIADTYWAHDKYHTSDEATSKPSLAGALLNGIMTIGNAIAYFESKVLAKSKIVASAIHITATKPIGEASTGVAASA